MHLSDKPGYLLLGKGNPSMKDLCRVFSIHHKTLEKCLKELLARGPLKQDSEGVYYCSRMVRDRQLAEINSANGSRGGNPVLIHKPDNPRLNPPVKASSAPPSPASSLSKITDPQTDPIPGELATQRPRGQGPLAGAIPGAIRSLIGDESGGEQEDGDDIERYAREMFSDLRLYELYRWNNEKASFISQVRKYGKGPFNTAAAQLKERKREGKRMDNELAYLIATASREFIKMHGASNP
jgi:hypothetical protein